MGCRIVGRLCVRVVAHARALRCMCWEATCKNLLDVVSRRRAHEPAAEPIVTAATAAMQAGQVALTQAKKMTTVPKAPKGKATVKAVPKKAVSG